MAGTLVICDGLSGNQGGVASGKGHISDNKDGSRPPVAGFY